MSVDFRLLGDVEVQIDDHLVEVGHARQRCVLVVLLLEVNRAVPADQLLERVWGHRPPHRARNVLSGYLSRLRQVLANGDGVSISRQPGGYVLSTEPRTVDVHRFREFVAKGRATDGDDRAAALLTQALRCWRGNAFATLDTPWLNDVRDVLEAERFAAELDRNDFALRAGRHAELVTEIAARVATHPLDERLAGQSMLALYRCGRQGDALAAFQEVRHRLVEELGADPSPPLQELHQQILAGDGALSVRPAGGSARKTSDAAVPRQLPAISRSFSGRTRELAELDALLPGSDDQATAIVISALSGAGGVGKTTLAVHWAQQNMDRFPDGQLYVNLRGFDPTGVPMAPGEAVRGFLEALGVQPQRIPTNTDAQVGLYRSLLAGRRVLVVLDNARDVDQVRPLLSGAPGCMALVTSRHQLTGLVVADGAVPFPLDLLTHDEARALLVARIGADRVALEPEAIEEVITLCARLPLALAIVAARAAAQRGLRLGTLPEQLRDVRDRLDALDVGDKTIDVRAVFSWSHRALDAEVARLFRLLGVHPGPDISVSAAASLAGASVTTTRVGLDELIRANLLTEPSPGRFAFHDLLRAYAGELADTVDPAEQHDAAVQRMRSHYLRTADTADNLLYPHRDIVDLPDPTPGALVDELADAGQALDWFTRERQVLVAVARQATGSYIDTYAWRLAWTMANYLDRRGHWADWTGIQECVLQTAVRRGDLKAQAVIHRGMQRAHLQSGQLDDVDRHGRHALGLFTQLGILTSQAQVHLLLGAAAVGQERNLDALNHYLRAKELYQDADHQAGQANAMNNAGFACVLLGEYERALMLCQEAIPMQQAIGDRYLEGHTFDTLGYAHQRLRHHDAAVASYQNALRLLREQGDRYSEADTLARLGDVYDDAGDNDAARRCRKEALEIYEELGHPDLQELRTKLGRVLETDGTSA